MAFYEDQDEAQDPNAQTPGVQTQSSSSVITPNASGPGGSSAPAAKTNSPDRPGNFVNLQDYLNANKTQAAKLGDQASGVINQSADNARQSVSSLNQEASDKIKPVNSLSTDVSDRIKNNAESLSPDERTQVKNTEKATYQGPQAYTDLNGYQAAADATQKASQNIDNSGTEQGRMGLISQINSKPRTQGMNVFDNALLQAGGGREKLAQASTANQDVKGGLDSASQAIQGQIGRADDPSTPDIDESAGAIGTTNKAQADASKTVQDALSAWSAGFQPKVTQAQQGLVDLQNRVTGDISDNPYNLSDETMNLLGLNRGERVFNNNLSGYLTQASPSDVNAANVASPEDYARYAALADLAGDQSNILDPANIGKAGTAPTMTADPQKLKQDIEKSQVAYDNAYKNSTDNVVMSDFIPPDRDGHGVAQGAFSAAAGMTPEYIENVYIPQLKQKTTSDWDEHAFVWAADALQKSVDQWRKNQGYNNIVNGYGTGGDLVAPPTFNGGFKNKI